MRKSIVTFLAACAAFLSIGEPSFASNPPPFNPANSVPGTLNLDASLLKRAHAALAAARAGTADATILVVGDSTSRTSLDGGVFTSPKAWPAKMAAWLSSAGYTVSTDSVCGASFNTTGAQYTTMDPRVTLGVDWSITQQGTAGGYIFSSNATGTTPISFTSSLAFDTVDVLLYGGSTPTTLNISINGGASSTSQTTTTFTVSKLTFSLSGTAGQTLQIQRVSGGGLFVLGWRLRSSTQARVHVVNCGWNSSNSIGWTSTVASPYDPQSVLAKWAPNVAIVGIGVNDWNPTSTALATYQANMTTLTSGISAYADVILWGQIQSNPATFASAATQLQYLSVQSGLAASKSYPWINSQYLWGSFANANSNALMGDDRHPNAAGSDDIARMFAAMLVGR